MAGSIYDEDPELHAEAEAQRKRYCESVRGVRWHDLEIIKFCDAESRLEGRPLVKGILEHEQTSMMVGETGCGKTFLALDLGLHIAAGLKWFGRKVDKGAVVYLATEAGRGIVNRIAAFKIANRLGDDDLPFAAVTSPIDLCHDSGDVDRIIDAISEVGLGRIVLLVIDTVSRALAGGNENAPDDMGAFVRSMDRLRDELQCHVLAVHHFGKNVAAGARGHCLLRCAIDTELEVTRDAKTGISTLTVTKQRDGATGGQLAFQLNQIELGRNQDDDPVTSCVVQPEQIEPDARRTGKTKGSPIQERVFEMLTEAINHDGQIPPPNNHIPPKTRCVSVMLWRDYAYAGIISSSDSLEAKRKAFQRASEVLIGKGRVGKWGDLVWVVQ